MIVSEEDEVGTYAFLVHKRLSDSFQSVSIPLTMSVSAFSTPSFPVCQYLFDRLRYRFLGVA
jgi:hypothetical protein